MSTSGLRVVKKRGELQVSPGAAGSRAYLDAYVFVRVHMYTQTNERRLRQNISDDIPHLIKSALDHTQGRMEVIETYPAVGEFLCRKDDFDEVCAYIKSVAEVRDAVIAHEYPAVKHTPKLTAENVTLTPETREEIRRVREGFINADADVVVFKFRNAPRGINFRKLVPLAYAYADGKDHTICEPLHIGDYATYASNHSTFSAFFYSQEIIDRANLRLPGSFSHPIDMSI
jgi:hypothetical protein